MAITFILAHMPYADIAISVSTMKVSVYTRPYRLLPRGQPR